MKRRTSEKGKGLCSRPFVHCGGAFASAMSIMQVISNCLSGKDAHAGAPGGHSFCEIHHDPSPPRGRKPFEPQMRQMCSRSGALVFDHPSCVGQPFFSAKEKNLFGKREKTFCGKNAGEYFFQTLGTIEEDLLLSICRNKAFSDIKSL